MLNKYIESLKEKFGKDKLIKAVIFIGIAGMILILLSDVIPSRETTVSETTGYIDTSLYCEQTEKQLEALLGKINGVGRVKVMVTIAGTEEYVYAEEVKESKSDGKSSQSQNNYVLVEKNGEKEALVNKVNNPQISGVVVVCDGGGNAKVCEVVYKTVSTVLGVPTRNIYVTKLS